MRTVARFRRGWAQLLTATVWASVPLLRCSAPVPPTPQDTAEDIRAWVDVYQESWNTHEASSVAAFFSEEADAIVGNGPRIVGREAVEA